MTQTPTYVLRPYKVFFVISILLVVCYSIVTLIAILCYIRYGMLEMLCAFGVMLIPVLLLFYSAHKANRIAVSFYPSGFEIRNDRGQSYKALWSDYKGIYWEYGIYGHYYILIFPNELAKAERKRICNRADFRLKCTTVLDDGFAIADPFCKGKKYSTVIPFDGIKTD